MQMWHGGRRWLGEPEIREPKKGRAEGGPGIYLTNKYFRATSYAKGGGVTTLVDLKDDLVLSKGVDIEIDAVKEFLSGVSRLKNRKQLTKDLLFHVITEEPRTTISGLEVVNLFVNWEAGTGQTGVELAEFLVEQGIHASLQHATGDEEWIVIHDPKAIEGWRVLTSAEAWDLEEQDMERPSEYLERVSVSAPVM